jgi:hypothetical protein
MQVKDALSLAPVFTRGIALECAHTFHKAQDGDMKTYRIATIPGDGIGK